MENLGLPEYWILTGLVISCIFSTLFPLTFLLTGWYKRILGRVLMANSIVLALALDFTLTFAFWRPSDSVKLYANILVFTIMPITTGAMYYKLFKYNIWNPIRDARAAKKLRESRDPND